MNPQVRAHPARESAKIGQRPPLVGFAHAVDPRRAAFDDDRTLAVRAVSPGRGHGSPGGGGGWR
jgi:hypothetical protein